MARFFPFLLQAWLEDFRRRRGIDPSAASSCFSSSLIRKLFLQGMAQSDVTAAFEQIQLSAGSQGDMVPLPAHASAFSIF